MAERDHILIELVKEVLGPRNGTDEILPETQDPRGEYITGVLAPAKAPPDTDNIEGEADDFGEEVTSEEDQDSQGYVVVPGVFSPALNPKELPRSVGLSFTVESYDGDPQLEICATWARYQFTQEGYQRGPSVILTEATSARQNKRWESGDGVLLQMRSRLLSEGVYRVSIFLVNVTEIPKNERIQTPDYLFQPQIRVHCCPGTRLVPVRSTSKEQDSIVSPGSIAAEDESLNLLYRDRTAYARGHLCGVCWREIDPERPHPSLPSPPQAPFAWTDAHLISEADKKKFSPADVRTELVPCYPIEVPEMDWKTQYGPSPVLNPEELAEIWHPDEVRDSLKPLVEGYRNWLTGQQQIISTLSPSQQGVANRHLEQCFRVADRIDEAIEVLVTDEEARISFCFANKAIALQSKWARNGQSLHWRPFQLAFILLNIPALVDPQHQDRRTCDLLWFPTGGGKTEAYLGLAAFTLALRRRYGSQRKRGHNTGAGVGVISRYTLRLLTIQQFRRALGVITACEFLRVQNLDQPGIAAGWRPRGCPNNEKFLWGGLRFSIGLWVGGSVTPNNMLSVGPLPMPTGGFIWYVGALDTLSGVSSQGYEGPDNKLQKYSQQTRRIEVGGEPAQVLTCPCCGAVLAVPDEGLGAGQHTLHFVVKGGRSTAPPLNLLQPPSSSSITIDKASYSAHTMAGYRTVSLTFTIPKDTVLRSDQLDEWWYKTIAPALGKAKLLAARPARPGYFLLTYKTSKKTTVPYDFELYCPDPDCVLNQHAWAEAVPLSTKETGVKPGSSGQISMGFLPSDDTIALPLVSHMQWQAILPAFQFNDKQPIAGRIPIPACTVDDQVYHRCPSLVIATVDKFARLAYEPKAASLFGNVDHYHSRWGYYREGALPSFGTLDKDYRPHPPDFSRGNCIHVAVEPFTPPDLILQDELHLIEGPLGSMVGLYESAIDLLCQYQDGSETVVPKYVASTATVRQAESQVKALFNRSLSQFPPSSISSDDRFFAVDRETHPLDTQRPGRLYVAICAPGKGAQTPIVRIWSSLLQNVYSRWQQNATLEIDRFWTLVGYFNAIRELAGALSLYRQDIPERLSFKFDEDARDLPQDRWLELSSRANSLNLPSLLKRLNVKAPDAQDAALATSMFGTGVDVDRLGLMVVHGQPKTTAAYIQATGRVGRQGGGLIVTFFRASRPRDLDHYEFFTGYHRALYRYVEPITVAPFSPRARERGLGPLAVILLRQAREIAGISVADEWRVQQRLSGAYFSYADRMGKHRNAPEVEIIPELLEERASHQPPGRRPASQSTSVEAESELDRWAMLAQQNPGADTFVYYESTLFKPPQRHVVLGDVQHRFQGYDEAYENAPQSLREIEETTGFKS